MAVVKQAVERLDNMEDSYSSVLIRLGVRHSANIAFCSENFKLFTQSMLYIWQYYLKGKKNLAHMEEKLSQKSLSRKSL